MKILSALLGLLLLTGCSVKPGSFNLQDFHYGKGDVSVRVTETTSAVIEWNDGIVCAGLKYDF